MLTSLEFYTIGSVRAYGKYQELYEKVQSEQSRANSYYAQLMEAEKELVETENKLKALQDTLDEAHTKECEESGVNPSEDEEEYEVDPAPALSVRLEDSHGNTIAASMDLEDGKVGELFIRTPGGELVNFKALNYYN